MVRRGFVDLDGDDLFAGHGRSRIILLHIEVWRCGNPFVLG
jgi:hypothetical protein